MEHDAFVFESKVTKGDVRDLFLPEVQTEFKGKTQVNLLKKIEERTQVWFQQNYLSKYPEEQQDCAFRASCDANFEGVEDFSPQFFELLNLACVRNDLTRFAIQIALEELDHGFDEFDKTLLHGSCDISRAYNPYYFSWIQEVQNADVLAAVKKKKPELGTDFYSEYTILHCDGNKKLYNVPFYETFKADIDLILNYFDILITNLEQLDVDDDHNYISYLKQYRYCLACGGTADELEKQWCLLDELWMNINHWIQIIHDIESGYGDALRVKCIPDFSFRFIDTTYDEANKIIAEIQGHMVEYFKSRNTNLSTSGITALSQTFAALYYIPFQTGMSYHFRFSGQSIPNRVDIKTKKGVKIYFDPVSTAARGQQTAGLVRKVFEDPETLVSYMDTVDTLVYHVGPHEIGHAIYNLEYMGEAISGATKTCLEEPRAELTAMFTLKLLFEKAKMFDRQFLDKLLASYMCSELRRFSMFDAQSTWPYTINAIGCFKIFFNTEYLRLNIENDTLVCDLSKTLDALTILSENFETILDHEDAGAGVKLDEILNEMQDYSKSEGIKWLLKKLFKGSVAVEEEKGEN